MNSAGNDCRQISRRTALTSTALVLGAVAVVNVVSRTAAQEKISQADGKTTPEGGQRCDACINLQPPNACKLVQGDISPNGWCQLFFPKIKS
jgi:hypothetical protein